MLLSYPLLASVVFASISAFFFVKWRILAKESDDLKRAGELSDLTVTASLGGYYYWDAEKNTEEFSLNLVRMFNLRKEVKSFEQFATLFKYDGDTIMHYFQELKNSNNPRFVFNTKAEISGETKHFQCSGNRVDDTRGAIIGIIIWFFDVSDYILRLKDTMSENSKIKDQFENSIALLNAIPMPIWQYNEKASIAFYNLMYSRLIDDGTIPDKNSPTPELDNSFKAHAKEVMKNQIPFHTRKHLILEGERRFFDITEVPVGYNRTVLGFARDITQQEELEKELESHISAHADLLESSSSAMAIYGRDTKLRFYNNAFVKLWNLEEKWLSSNPTYSEMLLKLRDERKLPEQADFQKFRESQLQLFQDLIKPHNEFFYLPNGTSLRVIVIPHALGGLLFAYEDMTDHLAMESSYNTLMAVQKETLDNLSEGIVVIGQDGRLKLWNPMYLELWPQTKSIIDQNPHLSDLLDSSKELLNYQGNWETFRDQIINQVCQRVPHIRRYERNDGKVVKRVSAPLPDGATLISFVDITDSTLVERSLRERTEALEEADRLKTEFLANASYELRTPLTSIMGFAEALRANLFGDLSKQQLGYISDIYDASGHLMSLINDILDLASLEAGYLTLDIKPFSVKPVLLAVITLLRQRAHELNVTIELQCDPNLPKMTGDERRIKQIAFNLLNNALKFTRPGSTVIVGAKENKDNEIKIWFEDAGVGITDEEKEKMFDKFFRVQSANGSDHPGTGLGLTVVKNIMDLHEGVIEIQSEKDKGTTISCYFELDGKKLVASEERKKQERAKKKKEERQP